MAGEYRAGPMASPQQRRSAATPSSSQERSGAPASRTTPDGTVTSVGSSVEVDPPGPTSRLPGHRGEALVWVAMALAVLPVLVAAVRASASDWLPMGDNAYFTVRSLDVLGPHHPLLGAWSSGSKTVGTTVNNLGPLQLDLLAPFTRVDASAGTAIGVALVNAASLIGVGLVVRRLASSTAVVVALATSSLVAWAMGSELLLEPRQHHYLILPFLCFTWLCWGLASGDRWLLPWAALVGSLLVQTHLSYIIIAPVLGGWGLLGLLATTRWPPDSGADPSWRPLRAPALTSAVVLAVIWLQTLIDQVTGRGNLSRLLDAGSGSEGTAPGIRTAVRIVGDIVPSPSGWLRSGFRDYAPRAPGSPGDGVLTPALGLLAVVLVLVGGAGWALRRHDRTAAAAPTTAIVALGGALVAAAVTPNPAPGNYRWLWPLVAFSLFAVVLALIGSHRSEAAVRTARGPTVVGVVAGAVLLVLTVANLPAAYHMEVTRSDLERRPVAIELLAELRAADLDGPVLFDRTAVAFSEPYSYLVSMVLQEEGIAFTFEDDSLDVARFGDGRADRGRADTRLSLVTGSGAREPRPGARRIAFATSLSDAEEAERAALTPRVFASVADGDLVPTDAARRQVDDGQFRFFAAQRAGEVAPEDFLRSDLRLLVEADGLTGEAAALAAARRLAQLDRRELFETVALYTEPQP